MNVHFKAFLPQDFKRVLELDNTAFPKEIQYSETELQNLFADPEVLCFTAKGDNDLVIGSCILKLNKLSGILRIISIITDEKFKTLGVGSLMLENVINAGKSQKNEKISIQIESNNVAGIALFEKYGFKFLKELKDFYKLGNKGQEMELLLPVEKKQKITIHSSENANIQSK